MKLWVYVVEARRLRVRDFGGSTDPYVRVKIADRKFRTKTVKKSLYPYWGEEFNFEINDLDEDLLIYVMDEDKFFKNDLVGQLQFNIEMIYDSPNKSLGTKWYPLHPKSKKSKRKDCGEILLSVLFSENNPFQAISSSNRNRALPYLDRQADQASELSSVSLSDILGVPIIDPSHSSSSTEKDNSYAQVSTPHPSQGGSMPGSPEMPKFKMLAHNGYGSNAKGQHSRSAPGSPETPKFKMHGHNVHKSSTKGQHSRSVPGSPETPKFKMHGHIVHESNTKDHHPRSMPGSQSSYSTEAEETTSSITEAKSYAQVLTAHPSQNLPRNDETTSTSKTSRSVPSSLDLEDASMLEVYSSVIPVPMKFFMELFGGGYLDSKVMEKVGCLDYSHTSWELVKPDVHQRQICYKFDKHVSHYRGEATSTQQLSSSGGGNGWIVEEVLTLHGIPFGDCFTVHCRYQVEDLSKSKSCTVKIFFGIVWHKNTKHQKRLTTNIVSNVVDCLKLMFSLVEREYIQEY